MQKNKEDWFLLFPRCALECRDIYKKVFKNIFGEFVSIGIFKTRKQRSRIKKNKRGNSVKNL